MMYSISTAFAVVLAVAGISRETELGGHWSWEGRHDRLMQTIVANGGCTYDVVFVGDGITDIMQNRRRGYQEVFDIHFGKYRTLNLGIEGDRIENVVWRLENGELDGYRAKVFRVLVGTGNIPKRWTPEELAAGIGQILDMIKAKHPESKIELVSILPRDDRKCPQDGMDRIRAANKLLTALADGEKVVLFDAAKIMSGADGKANPELFRDMLHLNRKGYETLLSAELSTIKRMLDE